MARVFRPAVVARQNADSSISLLHYAASLVREVMLLLVRAANADLARLLHHLGKPPGPNCHPNPQILPPDRTTQHRGHFTTVGASGNLTA